MVLGGTALISLGIGAVSGFYYAQKRAEFKYSEIAATEIAEAKDFYSRLNKKAQFSTPESAAKNLGVSQETVKPNPKQEKAVEAMIRYKGDGEVIEDVSKEMEEPVFTQNIFEEAQLHAEDDFDYAEEQKVRDEDPSLPYVVSLEEYMENESDHHQVSLTFFAGDDVLTDEKDQPIDDVEHTIGETSLTRFGRGSKDSKIVYVRNDKIDLDFEVILSKGSYTEEVMGFLKHSDVQGSRQRENFERRPKNRRFRDSDE